MGIIIRSLLLAILLVSVSAPASAKSSPRQASALKAFDRDLESHAKMAAMYLRAMEAYQASDKHCGLNGFSVGTLCRETHHRSCGVFRKGFELVLEQVAQMQAKLDAAKGLSKKTRSEYSSQISGLAQGVTSLRGFVLNSTCGTA